VAHAADLHRAHRPARDSSRTRAVRPAAAFRADYAGITLGSGRQLPHRPAVFIPWADVEKIILYPGRKAARFGDYIWASGEVECIGVPRREGAPALPHGNEQAPGCPVPGVAAGATRA
jgi:hypothetical protein